MEKTKNGLVSPGTPKCPDGYRKQLCWMMKKSPFTITGQMKNTLNEVDVPVSKSTVKRNLHRSKYRRFTARCKPL